MIDVVIARYKESLQWLDKFELPCHEVRFWVYDKDPSTKFETKVKHEYETLPNIGREAHTYLYYIINNYDNLGDEILFLQGNPFDHEKNWNIYQNFIDGKADYTKYKTFDIVSTQKHFFQSNPRYTTLFKEVFDDSSNKCLIVPPHRFEFSSGAQYIVKKEAILNRPIEVWQKLYDISLKSEQFPWDVERLWMYIFAI